MEQEIKDIIIEYGRDILCSDTFLAAFDQSHHYKSTVGDHTLSVTAEAVKFCLRHNLTDENTLSNVVAACLCHDMSLVGREEKYSNNLETLMQHPGDSADIYTDLTGESDERVLNAIRSHMFPFTPDIPKHREGWILTLADKISASSDILNLQPVTPEDRDDILEQAASRPDKR